MNCLSSHEKELLSNYALVLKYDWNIHARDKQLLPPGNWQTWLLKCGRGFGKNRVGAETIRIWKNDYPIIHLVGATASDVRDIMIEGESGLLNISPPWDRPHYEPSKRRVTWKNGSKAILYSADEPNRLRGPQCYKAWADELAAWRYPEAWDMLQLGLRLGNNPQCVVTTTPRPTKIIKELVADKTTVVTTGSSYENKDNLAKAFFDKIIKKYEGTTLGRQELYAEILEDFEGALWKMSLIDKWRVIKTPEMKRIVVAIDPAVTSNQSSDETGIITAGLGYDDRGYVLDDVSGIYTPNAWAKNAIINYQKFKADCIIGERNNGGEMIETILRNLDASIPYKSVWASRGKHTRAEPIQMLYEQGHISHVGNFPKLEEEMTTWTDESDWSPNRMDALVWAFTELMIEEEIDYDYS